MTIPISNMRAIFSNTEIQYSAIRMDVNAQAYAANSAILDLRRNNTSVFRVEVDGSVFANGSVIGGDATLVANAAFLKANAAYDQANSAYSLALAGGGEGGEVIVAAYEHANASFEFANTSNIHIYSAYDHTNAAFIHSNSSFLKANAANVHANSAYNFANTSNIRIYAAFDKANSAYDLALAGGGEGGEAIPFAYEHANAAYQKANSANIHANAAFNFANTSNIRLYAAYDHANAAYALAEAGGGGGGSTDIPITNNNVDATRYILFTDQTTNNLSRVNVRTQGLAFNPFSGTLSANNFNTLSDQYQKKNIEIIEYPLEKLSHLNGVTFNWKNSDEESVGVIAQDVKRVFPCLVDTENRVNYNGIIALLVECIKELNEKIESINKHK